MAQVGHSGVMPNGMDPRYQGVNKKSRGALCRSAQRVLVAGCVVLGCASAPARTPEVRPGFAAVDVPASEAGVNGPSIVQPYILLVTSATACPNGPSASIKAVVEADARYAQSQLGITFEASAHQALRELDPQGTHLPSPTPQQLKTAIDVLATSGKLVAGLVLLYSGHGVRAVPRSPDSLGTGARDAGVDTDVQPRSHLCLEDEPLQAGSGLFDVGEVVEWLHAYPQHQVPWLAMVLNACQSAYVDLRTVRHPAVGVLAASPEAVSVHPFANRTSDAGSCQMEPPAGDEAGNGANLYEVQPTPLIRATLDALRTPHDRAHDRNEDGIVTLHELLYILEDASERNWSDCDELSPNLKLQLQARSEIPIRFHDRAVDTRRTIRRILDKLIRSRSSPIRDDLVSALEAQLSLSTTRRLPQVQWDFVISEASEAGMDITRFENPRARPLTDCWGHLMHLSLAPTCLLPTETVALARFSIFSTFYLLKRQGSGVDVVRPHEDETSGAGRILQASTTRDALSKIRPRIDEVRSNSFRALTEVPDPRDCRGTALDGVLESAHFEVCEEKEGQCFAGP